MCPHKSACILLVAAATVFRAPAAGPVHVWEKQELTFTAARTIVNPYTEITMWVDLTGPDRKSVV